MFIRIFTLTLLSRREMERLITPCLSWREAIKLILFDIHLCFTIRQALGTLILQNLPLEQGYEALNPSQPTFHFSFYLEGRQRIQIYSAYQYVQFLFYVYQILIDTNGNKMYLISFFTVGIIISQANNSSCHPEGHLRPSRGPLETITRAKLTVMSLAALLQSGVRKISKISTVDVQHSCEHPGPIPD